MQAKLLLPVEWGFFVCLFAFFKKKCGPQSWHTSWPSGSCASQPVRPALSPALHLLSLTGSSGWMNCFGSRTQAQGQIQFSWAPVKPQAGNRSLLKLLLTMPATKWHHRFQQTNPGACDNHVQPGTFWDCSSPHPHPKPLAACCLLSLWGPNLFLGTPRDGTPNFKLA